MQLYITNGLGIASTKETYTREVKEIKSKNKNKKKIKAVVKSK